MVTKIARWLFFTLIVRPLILIVLGLNVRNRERLPNRGPAIIAANHNSHLDTLVLITLMPPSLSHRVRPVAAADYFLRNRLLAWFAKDIIGILPITRQRIERGVDPLEICDAALKRGEILIFFPEGTRGEPERINRFRRGIAHLAERHPDVPVVPVFMRGLGKALPKGEALLVPFLLDVYIGEPLTGRVHADFLNTLRARIRSLAETDKGPEWD
ncbi:lysophospholipid acyltransferase family protein [Nitrosococcus oceani]|nr:lysophospholipid acyltransferase family protein [Nitrosococcus oceani]